MASIIGDKNFKRGCSRNYCQNWLQKKSLVIQPSITMDGITSEVATSYGTCADDIRKIAIY